MEVCPTQLVLATAERVWHLLTDPRALAHWSGTKLVEGPTRPLCTGDHLVLRAGLMHVTFDVVDMEAPRQLTLRIALPFRIVNHERIQIVPVDTNSCRVTFN